MKTMHCFYETRIKTPDVRRTKTFFYKVNDLAYHHVSQNDPFSYFLNYSLKNQLISIIFADISKLRKRLIKMFEKMSLS